MMDNENTSVVIDVRDVKKKFNIYFDRGSTFKERILFKNRRRHEVHWVLRGISFKVKKGEAIGLVGENGCGKSTTLKMLTKILYPDEGTITMKGRVSSLIELGAGFHPDMSGRENIYTNASIFGLKKEEIDNRLQQIIDFSELGDYIDNPVRTYSSGMYTRLAFAVAINVDADILLIDEILAVGDAAFQAKCFNRLRDIKKKGTTIVIVSHSLGQIEQICDRSIWINNGYIQAEGKPMDVHQKYLRFLNNKSTTLSERDASVKLGHSNQDTGEETEGTENNTGEKAPESDKRWGSKDIVFTEIRMYDHESRNTTRLQAGEPFRIEMDYQMLHPVENVSVGVGIFRNDGLQCYGTNTDIDHQPLEIVSSEGTVVFDVPYNGLLEGTYLLDVALHRPDGFPYDYYRECMKFTVLSVEKDVGVMRLQHTWKIQ